MLQSAPRGYKKGDEILKNQAIYGALGLVGIAWLVALDGQLRASQEPSPFFGRVTVEQGLPHGAVTATAQDDEGFLWFGTQDGLCRFDGYGCRVFRHDPQREGSLPYNSVWALLVDRGGTLWLGNRSLVRFDAEKEIFEPIPLGEEAPQVHELMEDRAGFLWVSTDMGLYRYEPEGREVQGFRADPENPDSLHNPLVTAVYEDSTGALWVGTYAGLHRFDASRGVFERFLAQPDEPGGLPNDLINDIHEDAEGILWIATAAGLYSLDRSTGRFSPFRTPEVDLSTARIFGLHLDGLKDFWVGTANDGLYRRTEEGALFHYVENVLDPHGLVGNRIRDIFEDRTGALWFATYVGVSRFDRRQQQFETWRRREGAESALSGNSISAIQRDGEGKLWVGTWDRGLNRLDRTTGQVWNYRADPQDPRSLPDATVTSALTTREGSLYVGTWGGLARFRGSTGDFDVWRHDPADPSSLSDDAVNTIYQDSTGTIWVGTITGVDRFDPSSGTFQHIEHGTEFGVDQFVEDHRGELWFTTPEELRVFNSQRTTSQAFDPRTEGCDIGFSPLAEDSEGRLWFGTNRGLGRLGADRKEVRCYQVQDGLSSDTILALLPGDGGDVWLTTNQGLSHFDSATESFTNYGEDDGLQSNSFSARSAYRSPEGELFFGGIRGFNAFFPDRIELDPHPAPVLLTEFLVHNEPFRRGDEGSERYFEGPIREAETLVLTHRDRMVSFEFTSLHYAAPELNRFMVRLEGFDHDWVETTAARRFATYTNLPPGDYHLRLRGSNKDGLWSEGEQALKVVVKPPPWRSGWAYGLYVLAFCGAVLAYTRYQHKKLLEERAIAEKERSIAETQRSMNQKLREMDRFKDELLAKTSHELRTPLYGITGLAEALLDSPVEEMPAEARKDLGMIVASGRRLSGLVNDILDVSRLENQQLELKRRAVDLKTLTGVVLAISRPLVGSKPLRLVDAVPEGLPSAWADENRLEQILHNLVGNAIKFSNDGVVEVAAREEDGSLLVSVRDTGVGIEPRNQERVFQAFEQADASIERVYGGTGLGLAVTRQLVELHGGRLWCDSAPGRGSTFFFTLPLAEAGWKEPSAADIPAFDSLSIPSEVLDGITEPEAGETLVGEPDAAVPRILIVDDEPVVRQVLFHQVTAAGYQADQASDGTEGLRLLEGNPYDLILLDVMMPRLSGYEVCRLIRRTHGTRELPILFLSAKGQPADRVAGLEAGANDYLTKPVDRSELLARVALHLELLRMHRDQEELLVERTSRLKILSGLLPICFSCRKIRDDEGYWDEIENYIASHSEAEFSHGLCPECAADIYLSWQGREKPESE